MPEKKTKIENLIGSGLQKEIESVESIDIRPKQANKIKMEEASLFTFDKKE